MLSSMQKATSNEWKVEEMRGEKFGREIGPRSKLKDTERNQE